MKKDNTALYAEAVENLLEMYKSNKLPEAAAWSIIKRRKGESEIPSDKWSLGNLVLMYGHNTLDARGYKQWQSVGRFVKKGSKAFHILGPNARKIKTADSDGQEEEKIIITGFHPISVFRIEDTDGEPVKVTDYTPEELPPLWDAAKHLGIEVKYAPMYRPALGTFSTMTNKINLYADDAIVYFHELAHAVEHNFVHKLQTLTEDVSEATAEFAAMVLCQIIGITGYEKQGFKYIEKYANIKEDNDSEKALKMIMNIMNDTEKIVNIILDAADGIVPDTKAA